jgi:hypothetical protein
MADTSPANSQVERKEDFGTGKEADIRRWLTELNLARKGHRKRWLNRYKKIEKRYRDELSRMEGDDSGDDVNITAGFNLLWANVRTTAASYYSKAPKPIVERRHKDESLVARAACVILQRALLYQMKAKNEQFHAMMKGARLDFQLGGFAEGKVRYERDYAKPGVENSELSKPVKAPPDGVTPWENVVSEEICFDYQHPEDFLCSSAKGWPEVHWVAFRTHMTRDQIGKCEMFGDEKRRKQLAKDIPCNSRPDGMSKEDSEKADNGAFMRAPIWAIWDKTDRQILYVCEDYTEDFLGRSKDPSSLEGFFPCPPPARGTFTNNTLWPVPDYIEYGSQAREVDELTKRMDAVLESIRVIGTYDQDHEELKQILDGGYENKLIAVKAWQEFAEKGGLEGATDFLPIDQYAKVLDILVKARAVAKADADQMAGVFDVMRGDANPNEKLGTQKLKAGYGAQRTSEPKEELALFARNMLAIAGEMIAEHFSPASLWQMSDFGTWWKGQERGLKAKAQRLALPAPQGAPVAAPSPPPAPGAPPGLPGAPGAAPGAPAGLPPGVTPGPGYGGPPAGGMSPAPSPAPAPGMGGPAGPLAAPMAGGPAPMPAPPPQTPPLPSAEEIFGKAVELLRSEKLRGFVITIETDSTIEPDMEVEQQRRTMFLEAVSVFMEKSMLLGAQLPEAVPLISQMLLFAVRGFGASRELETAFEVFLDKMQERAANPPPKPPSPEQMKAESEKAKIEADRQTQERQAQHETQKLQAELDMAREKHAMDMQRMQMELQVMEKKLELMAQEAQLKLQLQQEQNQLKIQTETQKAAMQERQMVREDQRAQSEDARAERQGEREEELAERSMEREEGHAERMMETKEKQAAAKPKPGQK